MAPFTKPEAVLKNAEGLIAVGQSHAALQSLSEMFSSKRFRSTPVTSLEPIMLRFVELCVEMRKGRMAKEGLMQYKNIAQNASVSSVEIVISKFIALGEQKVADAQAKATQIEAAGSSKLEIDDLEASETPESILLGAVSGDVSKDRTDRALVTPWLKFLWESYRTALETLKNNARLENIYQQIAQQAFKFCLSHARKVEFRRLCETLRLHLSNVAKYAHQPHSINLSDPDTLQHHLDTRFAQLNTSVHLELWQEAFRSVEDVHNLLTLAKKAPKAAMMANYYEKLTKIFLTSGNSLFHAAAWNRYYAVLSANPGLKTDEEMRTIAGQVLVSALAVPVGTSSTSATPSLLVSSDDQFAPSPSIDPEESTHNNAKLNRLTALLGLSKPPARSSLLKDALARDVLKFCPPTVKKLYQLLQERFDPLQLCDEIAPVLVELAESPSLSVPQPNGSTDSDPSSSEESKSESIYRSYLPLLNQSVLSRLLSHLAQVYTTLNISFLMDLVQPLKVLDNVAGTKVAMFGEMKIISYIMGCARRGELGVRVDCHEARIDFITPTSGAYGEEDGASRRAVGDEVQKGVHELVNKRLSSVGTALWHSLSIIEAEEETPQSRALSDETKAAILAERKALSNRLTLSHHRNLLTVEHLARIQQESQRIQQETIRAQSEQSLQKQREDLRQKELARLQQEREAIRINEAKKYAKTLVEGGVLKKSEIEKMEEEAAKKAEAEGAGSGFLDTEDLISIQVKVIEKEKKEVNRRVKLIQKRIDHLERAIRREEIPLLDKDYRKQQQLDRENHERLAKEAKQTAKDQYAKDMEAKKRLSRMVPDYNKHRETLLKKRGEDFAKKKDAAAKKMAEEKAKRRKTILAKREEERKKQEEEERRIREEEERARAEEEERLAEEERRREAELAAQEEEERAKREAEEKQAELRKQREAERQAAAEQARLQLQREEEAEQKRLQRAAERKREAMGIRKDVEAPARDVWRRGNALPGRGETPNSSTPPTPTRSSITRSETPRAESPTPAPAKYRPPGAGGAGGGWRARERANLEGGGTASGAATPVRSASPAPPKEEAKVDDDGFQTVEKKKEVWKPRRGRF